MNYLATHVGCDDCGSSDALSVSVNDKGETWSHCFACGTNTKMSEDVDNFRQKHTKSAKVIPMLDGKYQSIPLRNLSRDALKAFGVMITEEGGVAFPYCDADGKVTAYKVRHDAIRLIALSKVIGLRLLCSDSIYSLKVVRASPSLKVNLMLLLCIK